MLVQFNVKNHKCFYEKNTLDLTSTQEKRHSNHNININGINLLPIIAIHGANASGKSGILEAINFMFTIILKSNSFDINDVFPTVPFTFSEKARKENSEYEVSLCLNGNEYRYGFAINEKGIDEEWLYTKKFTKDKRVKEKMVFERDKNNVIFGSSYEEYAVTYKLLESPRALVLTTLAPRQTSGMLRDIFEYIKLFNYREEKILRKNISINILTQNNTLYNKFQEIIRESDPCLEGINLKKTEFKDENGNIKYIISGIHRGFDDNKKYLLPIEGESNGTIKIFDLMPSILLNLEYGGLLCIDELDIKFHPLLFKKIVNMYLDKKINKKNAQLIFTAHSTFMFNSRDLRRDELYLIEKDNFGKSNIFSISEFRNLRYDTDYEKKYLSGEFGAIPFKK